MSHGFCKANLNFVMHLMRLGGGFGKSGDTFQGEREGDTPAKLPPVPCFILQSSLGWVCWQTEAFIVTPLHATAAKEISKETSRQNQPRLKASSEAFTGFRSAANTSAPALRQGDYLLRVFSVTMKY